jgi:hypothetical protein
MYLTVALAVMCFLSAIVLGVFPWWLGGVLVVAVPVSMMFRPQTDMRGGAALDASGRMQAQVLIVLNLIIVVWLVQAVVFQWLF